MISSRGGDMTKRTLLSGSAFAVSTVVSSLGTALAVRAAPTVPARACNVMASTAFGIGVAFGVS